MKAAFVTGTLCEMKCFGCGTAPCSRAGENPIWARDYLAALGSRLCGSGTVLLAWLITVNAHASSFTAPNLVVITPKIVTSSQPTAKALSALGEDGFEAVIYLVPTDVPSPVADEAAIVKRQGLEYIHIPIPFNNPTAQHYDDFARTMARLTKKRVLVHCEINLRASSMVFLYRTIALREDPQTAYESVLKVWSPRGAWRPFIEGMLRKNSIKFELY